MSEGSTVQPGVEGGVPGARGHAADLAQGGVELDEEAAVGIVGAKLVLAEDDGNAGGAGGGDEALDGGHGRLQVGDVEADLGHRPLVGEAGVLHVDDDQGGVLERRVGRSTLGSSSSSWPPPPSAFQVR